MNPPYLDVTAAIAIEITPVFIMVNYYSILSELDLRKVSFFDGEGLPAMIGIIGGSGLYEMPGFVISEKKPMDTPYGNPSDDYIVGFLGDVKIVFLARHSHKHDFPPHRVNYRANIWGLRELGVERIIAVNAVGGINPDNQVGDIVLPDQIIDFTKTRAHTFYEEGEVVHVDFTEPYCPELRKHFLRSSGKDVHIIDGGTYVCTDGPRLETAGEIRFFKTIGADVVGMTGMPEAALARELQLCYFCIAVVTNYAAGIRHQKLTTVEVVEAMKRGTDGVKLLISGAIKVIPPERKCSCKESLRDAKM
jgi:5'-methylthioadenosine phosphorylase